MLRTLVGLALAVVGACGPKPAAAPSVASSAVSSSSRAPSTTITPPALTASAPHALDLERVWTSEQMQPILAVCNSSRIAPDVSHLTAAEHAAVAKLLEVGQIMQDLYEDQRHIDAPQARALLASLDKSPRSEQLRRMYRVFHGPITPTPDRGRVSFLGTRPPAASGTMYPWGIERAEIDAFLTAHPDRREAILAPRTAVRRAEHDAIASDLAALVRHPVLDALHPKLRQELEALQAKPQGLYAVPYSVAFADQLTRAHALLEEAAAFVANEDPELARYLRNRGRDLLTNDYESGDAAWLTGTFKNLNAQIGAYETENDELYGVKTYFGFAVLIRRADDGAALAKVVGALQAIEDTLPYAPPHRKLAERIPMHAYDVIADFGQSRRGTQATLLPNEPYLLRRYGRVVLIRANILRDPPTTELFNSVWRAAVLPAHETDLTPDGMFRRTEWYELSRYVGVDRTRDGRTLEAAYGESDASLLEKLEGDLFALYLPRLLRDRGQLNDAEMRADYAANVQRMLRSERATRGDSYELPWLMQINYLLEKRVLRFDATRGQLGIDYGRMHGAVRAMLARVLELQRAGDRKALDRFVAQYSRWDDALHGVIGRKVREAIKYRRHAFYFAALGE